MGARRPKRLQSGRMGSITTDVLSAHASEGTWDRSNFNASAAAYLRGQRGHSLTLTHLPPHPTSVPRVRSPTAAALPIRIVGARLGPTTSLTDLQPRPSLPAMTDYEGLKEQWSEIEDRDGVRLSWNTFPSSRMVRSSEACVLISAEC
jgi:hypothetical protein